MQLRSLRLLVLASIGCLTACGPANEDPEPPTSGESGDTDPGDGDGDGDPGDGDGDPGDGDGDGACQTTSSELSQYGITWTFAADTCFGTFANGDYWVLGPVTITSISPDFDGQHHGWEANPADSIIQGFDVRIADYDPQQVPPLPYEASPGQSIVKGISLEPLDDEGCRPCLQTAAVLTVLADIPSGQGQGLFRPPYFGADKPSYAVDDLDLGLLPQLAPVPEAPDLGDQAAAFARVQLDHKENWTGRALHPVDNLPDYGAAIASRNAEGALRLMLDEAPVDKLELAITYVQYGIDIYYAWRGGVTWPPNGGHSEGRKLPAVMASVLLQDSAMQDALAASEREDFGENAGVYYSQSAGTVLYGPALDSELNYWTNIVFDTGSRTIRDPYEHIDGGYRPGDSYQFCCLAKPWTSTSAAISLMPELAPVWNLDDMLAYVDRWIELGAYASPDPCAPPDGTCAGGDNAGAPCTSANGAGVCAGMDGACDLSVGWDTNYGLTYGPDGQGGCILDQDMSDGLGRFPQLHGASTDDGNYGSAFAEALRAAHLP